MRAHFLDAVAEQLDSSIDIDARPKRVWEVLPRADMPRGLEARTADPLQRAAGSPARARAAWAFIHGMIMLELNERFPDDSVTELAWQSGIAALQATAALR